MSTLRHDPTNGEWVILAPQRSRRPHNPVKLFRPSLPEHDPRCPFCPGNEDMTPAEITRVPAEDGWSVRVVPNLYAVLSTRDPSDGPEGGLFGEMPGAGSHEVVIESPAHNGRFDEMLPSEVAGVIAVWRDRYQELIDRPEIRAVVVFKNYGLLAGTSLAHPHSQIVATPVFTPHLLRGLDVARRHFTDNGSCVYDDVLAAELEVKERIICESERFVAFEPFASASPYETWILPRRHEVTFGGLRDDELDDLAEILVEISAAISEACGDPDWNLVVYSAPKDGYEELFHWHVKLIPRLTTPAGFELGSAMGINTVAPELAAAALREALTGPVQGRS